MIATAGQFENEQPFSDNWVSKLQPVLTRFAALRLKDVQLAEDAVQDTLLTVFCGADQFRGDCCFESWVFSILRRKIVDSQRREMRQDRLAAAFYDEKRVTNSGDVSDSLQLAETQEVIANEIDNMPRRLGKVMRLVLVDNLSCEAIADRLGISQGNVWVRIHRARKHLKRCL